METRHFVVNLSSIVLTFVLGVASSLVHTTDKLITEEPPHQTIAPAQISHPETPPPIVSKAAPVREGGIGKTHLRIVATNFQRKSEHLRYDVNVSYPQVVGSNAPYIRRLNKRIKDLASEEYRWMLTPSKTDLRNYRIKWPDVFNSLEL